MFILNGYGQKTHGYIDPGEVGRRVNILRRKKSGSGRFGSAPSCTLLGIAI